MTILYISRLLQLIFTPGGAMDRSREESFPQGARLAAPLNPVEGSVDDERRSV
jgi:hypothetical protein